jgi:hypothetical protein
VPTQDVFGLLGSVRNDAVTIWAHGEWGNTKCPMPGMLMIVAFDRLAATDVAKSNDVTASKLPEMSSVGMLLTRGWRTSAGGGRDFPDPAAVIVGICPGGDSLILYRGRVERKSLPTGFDDLLMCGELLTAANAVRQPVARGGSARL